jgi:peptidyl-prolyl cis-trans isomerase A (cyclophilin A)
VIAAPATIDGRRCYIDRVENVIVRNERTRATLGLPMTHLLARCAQPSGPRTWIVALALAAGAGGCAGGDEPSFRPARATAEDRAPSRPVIGAGADDRGGEPPAATPPATTPPSGAVDVTGALVEEGPTVTEVQASDPRLLSPAAANEQAPAQYTVELDTTEGPLRIEVTRAWSPNGADRFWNLVRIGYYTDIAFFRVVDGFMAQAGIHGRPDVNAAWRSANIPDDPPVEHNTRGMVSFAMAGPGTRTTQFFINMVDNSRLDPMGFAPFGRVRDMGVVDRLHDGYGEGAPAGRGPAQARMQREGNAYLRADFPELDYIRSARIVSPAQPGDPAAARAPAGRGGAARPGSGAGAPAGGGATGGGGR